MAWKKINLNGPDGNVFAIMGYFGSLKKQLAKENIDVSEYTKLQNDFKNMEYEQIISEVERISNGLIIFVKPKEEEEPEPEEVDPETETQVHGEKYNFTAKLKNKLKEVGE